VVRVLSRHDPARAKPDLALISVHSIHAAHDPFAFGDLIFHAPRLRVVEIQMAPTVAFAHPNQLAGVIEPFEEILPAVVDERLALLIDDGGDASRFRRRGRDETWIARRLRLAVRGNIDGDFAQ